MYTRALEAARGKWGYSNDIIHGIVASIGSFFTGSQSRQEVRGAFKQSSAGVTLAPIDFRPIVGWFIEQVETHTHNSPLQEDFCVFVLHEDQVHTHTEPTDYWRNTEGYKKN